MLVNVLAGKSVTLKCESNAVPPPAITWYKNGRLVTESSNLRILAKGQMLEIKGSEVRDVFHFYFLVSVISSNYGRGLYYLSSEFFLFLRNCDHIECLFLVSATYVQ